jgi:hypothetical protein
MQCTLLVPDLFLTRAVHDEAYRDLPVPALERLLSRSDAGTLPGESYEAWLCRAFGVVPDPDWPVAALTLVVDGGAPGEGGYWLRADPVHLRATRDHVSLIDASALAIRTEEAEALVAALNAYFSDDTRWFLVPHPERWYLRLDAPPQIATRTLLEAIGKDVHPLLPAGPQALYWHYMGNEIQMLLHAHAVNEARSERGEPTINSIWLWGGGLRPAACRSSFSSVWSEDVLALGLAGNAGLPASAEVPPAKWLDSTVGEARGGHRLVVLDQLMLPARHDNMRAWRENLARLEGDWFAPLLRALQARRVARLTIAVPGAQRSVRFEVTPAGLLRIWRRVKSLGTHATAHGG